MNAPGALFLDRDGTIITHKPYLHQADEVELVSTARVALKRAWDQGWKLFLFTNQSGIGRGLFRLEDVEMVHSRMLELLDLSADLFAGICIAPERPDQPVAYRKPSPRFILEVMHQYELTHDSCWMIGDSPSDWETGLAGGIRVCAVRSGLTTSESERMRKKLRVPLFENLLEAVLHVETLTLAAKTPVRR
jgi:D-glycero-D-manno-heptose 1,7-bisphosphate phosphatase